MEIKVMHSVIFQEDLSNIVRFVLPIFIQGTWEAVHRTYVITQAQVI